MKKPMKHLKMAAAGALALTLAVGGVVAVNDHHAKAAALPDEATAGTTAVESSGASTSDRSFRGGMKGFLGLVGIQDEVAALLSLDEAALREKLQTQTLAAVAEAQGVARADLTAKLTTWIQAEIDAAAADSPLQAIDAAKAAEQLLDRTGAFFGGKGVHRGGKGMMPSVASELQELLGMSDSELQTALREGKTLAVIAGEQGVDVQKLIDAQVTAMTEQIDAALAAGKLTQTEYDARKATLADQATKLVNGELDGKASFGKGGMKLATNDEELATLLGLTTEALQTALDAGKTLAAIAGDQGVDVQAVIDLQAKRMTAKLDEALAAGAITQAQYDARKADIVDRATDMVNNGWTRGARGHGGHGGRGFGGGMKPGAAAPSDATDAAATTTGASA